MLLVLLSILLAPVVQKEDSAIHRINHFPVDSAIGFPNTYPLDSDLSGPGCSNVGQGYPRDKSLSCGQVLGEPMALSSG